MAITNVAQLAGDSSKTIMDHYAHIIDKNEGAEQMLNIFNRPVGSGTDSGTEALSTDIKLIGS